VLDEGVRVERVGDGALPGLLDDRKFQVMEIARALGIPPQMLYQSDAGALSSQVEMQRQYVDGTVAGWCDRFATSLSSKILPQGVKLKFEVNSLMRGNLRDIAASLKDLATTGALTIGDAREMLGLAYVDSGDMPLTPAVSASTAPGSTKTPGVIE
jgi:phage portal protein BeeE